MTRVYGRNVLRRQMSDNLEYDNFIESLPAMFATAMQKATMCSFIWNGLDVETIVYNLRLYDLIRRLHNVKMREEGYADDIMPLFRSVKQNPEILDFFMHYVRTGKFPDTKVVGMLKDM